MTATAMPPSSISILVECAPDIGSPAEGSSSPLDSVAPVALEPASRPRERRAPWTARIFSLAALGGCVAALGFGASAAYHAVNDAYVAPLILSPDNDLVIQSKLNLMRLVAERENLTAKLEEHEASLEATTAAIDRLRSLQASSSHALDWSRVAATQQGDVDARNLKMLTSERGLIQDSIVRQSGYIDQLRSGLGAGLVHRADLERETIALNQLELAALVNEQESNAASARRKSALAMQRAVTASAPGGGAAPPEVLAHRDQEVRLELDILKLEAERRSRLAQERADHAALAHVDELLSQMKARPVFRAIDGSQNVAFVPYTQMDSVRRGADVYACSVWGVFDCSRVGSVAEVVPGEVAAQDPWGTLARGQYAVLDLSEASAGRARSLRVRSSKLTPEPAMVSAR